MINLKTSRLFLRTPKLRRQTLSTITPKLAPRSDEPKRKSLRRGPGKHWESKPAVIVKPDGREICNPVTDEGRAEYEYRKLLMWIRQDGWCCFREYDFCSGRLHLSEATFQHESLRGKNRDDRIWIPEKRKPTNGVCHWLCNSISGSRRLPIYHGTNVVMELRHE